jgi:hypothetical protein
MAALSSLILRVFPLLWRSGPSLVILRKLPDGSVRAPFGVEE